MVRLNLANPSSLTNRKPSRRCRKSGWPRPGRRRLPPSTPSSRPGASNTTRRLSALIKDRDALLAFYNFPAEPAGPTINGSAADAGGGIGAATTRRDRDRRSPFDICGSGGNRDNPYRLRCRRRPGLRASGNLSSVSWQERWAAWQSSSASGARGNP
jgi:hypothetical protein